MTVLLEVFGGEGVWLWLCFLILRAVAQLASRHCVSKRSGDRLLNATQGRRGDGCCPGRQLGGGDVVGA